MSEPGYTSSSSANGASVASMRAPRTTIASLVSPTLCSDTWPIACSASGLVRSTCGFMSAWVGDIDQALWVIRRGGEHLVGVLVLEVEHARHRQRGVAQLGMIERMADHLALEPDLAATLSQAVEELLARAGAGHLRQSCVRHQ